MPTDRILTAQYQTAHLPRRERIQDAQYVQQQIRRLEGNLQRIQQGIELQQKQIKQNKTVIEKTTISGLKADIVELQEKLTIQEQICKNGTNRDLTARRQLIEKIKTYILNKNQLIETIEALPPGEVLPVVKIAQETLPKQEENLRKLQQMAEDLEAELEQLYLMQHSDAAHYMRFFQNASQGKSTKVVQYIAPPSRYKP